MGRGQMKYNVEWLQKAINNASVMRKMQEDGEAYYRQKNTAIMERRKLMGLEDGTTIEDPYKANHKLPSGYLKLLIEQKINYSINSKMTSDEDIDAILGTQWKRDFEKAAREASKKGFGCWQMYLKGNKVKYKKIPSEQIIPCYDSDDILTQVVRTYKKNRDGKAVNVAEIWDNETYTIYEQETNQDWICTTPDKFHVTTNTSFGGTITDSEESGWGVVPFVIFKNNEYLESDLNPIKPLIDIYDLIKSDFANNLDDFQDAWWVLRNYDGQGLNEFIKMQKQFRAVKVSDDGDARRETAEIPHESKMVFLNSIKDDIYTFGMGVDTSKIEGNVTNVRIMAMYNNLDLKANSFEFEATKFIDDVITFTKLAVGVTQEDLDDIDTVIDYDRSMIINELEKSTLANTSIGSVSEYTRLSNDPRVDDVEFEIASMVPVREAVIE